MDEEVRQPPAASQRGWAPPVRQHLRRLVFIDRSREPGSPIEQVRRLLAFADEPHHTCAEVNTLALQQADQVRYRIDDLRRPLHAPEASASRCDRGGPPADRCPVIDALFAGSAAQRHEIWRNTVFT